MKLSKTLIILLAIIFYQIILYSNCYSASWQYVVTGEQNKIRFYIDIDSIQINYKKEQIRFWKKAIEPDGSYTKALYLCNYNEISYIMLQIDEYDKRGKVVYSYSFNQKESNKSYISPESCLEECLDAALSLKRR